MSTSGTASSKLDEFLSAVSRGGGNDDGTQIPPPCHTSPAGLKVSGVGTEKLPGVHGASHWYPAIRQAQGSS